MRCPDHAHGSPGSVIELLEAIGPFTDPPAYGGDAEDAFDLVLPSLPGYGFSAEPAEVGWDPGRIARAWAELMGRLGYTRYAHRAATKAPASPTLWAARRPRDWPASPRTSSGGDRRWLPCRRTSEQERAAREAVGPHSGTAASAISWSKPRGRRPSATPFWVHPSPWRPGCSTTTPTATARSPGSSSRQPSGSLTKDHILDNITLYWLTGTGASAARSYLQGGRARRFRRGSPRPEVTVPVGFTTFPDEIFRAPRSWVEKAYPNLPTSTKPTEAAISPPGKSPSCSLPRSGPRSRRCANDSPHRLQAIPLHALRTGIRVHAGRRHLRDAGQLMTTLAVGVSDHRNNIEISNLVSGISRSMLRR